MTTVVGWDLGGANLKLACVEDGCVAQAAQIPCPTRQDASKFDYALAEALSICPNGSVHAVTMTGELSDVFTDRIEGVAYLVDMMRNVTDGEALFYGSRSGLLDCIRAVERAAEVASANWHASASLIAHAVPDALLIDIGTTTTDLLPVKEGAVTARGYSDGERLTERELVYSGAVRTPVMAIARAAPFKGRMQGVAAERFATMADVWRLLGELPAGADPYPTPDLKGKSTQESAARLARMLGRDAGEVGLLAWVDVARYFADAQLADIEAAAAALLGREALTEEAPVIGGGCGRFIARLIAERLGRCYFDFAELIDCAPEAREMAAVCAPAVAVGLLAANELTIGGAKEGERL
ncbi:MAG TPA: hydantoinase/oxoprolinase family protein [Methyloceanibacter sp.]|nr:hydantoinase/oxoprolinase family protein [Methyloceanibacter sp.]